MNLTLRLVATMLLLAMFVGCGKGGGHSHGGGHAHKAPHGGTLVEVGDHAYNLELVRDAAAGKLTAYVLDGHAENFVRIKAPAIEAVATVGAEPRPLTLRAIANAATGETVGDSSQFEVQADWLKTAPNFDVTVLSIEIRGSKFTPTKATIPKS